LDARLSFAGVSSLWGQAGARPDPGVSLPLRGEG
jgi:hypothetical protein